MAFVRQAVSLTKPVMGEMCIEVTIGSEESFVGVLDRPKHSSYYVHTHVCMYQAFYGCIAQCTIVQIPGVVIATYQMVYFLLCCI